MVASDFFFFRNSMRVKRPQREHTEQNVLCVFFRTRFNGKINALTLPREREEKTRNGFLLDDPFRFVRLVICDRDRLDKISSSRLSVFVGGFGGWNFEFRHSHNNIYPKRTEFWWISIFFRQMKPQLNTLGILTNAKKFVWQSSKLAPFVRWFWCVIVLLNTAFSFYNYFH